MITVRKSEERGHTQLDWLDSRHTFSFDQYMDPKHINFGALRVINEDVVAPGKGFNTHGHRDMEIITLVLEGTLAHRDSLGNGSAIKPGDVQRMSAGTGIRHSEFNPSTADSVHLLQVWILPKQKGLDPSYEQKNFELGKTPGEWILVASEDGRDGSVTVHQDLNLYQTYLPQGQQSTFTLEPNRQIWLQVACGYINVNDELLNQGDGLAIRNEHQLTIKALEPTEVYLFEMTQSDETIIGEDV